MEETDSDSLLGKKKRGRPKKVKSLDDQPLPEPECKMDAAGNEIIKKRRGRPKKIHQQQKLAEREAKEREHQQMQQLHHQQQQHYQQSMLPHHMHHPAHQQSHQILPHMSDGYGSVPGCFSPPLMSPPKPFSHMAPYPHQMGEPSGFFGQSKLL